MWRTLAVNADQLAAYQVKKTWLATSREIERKTGKNHNISAVFGSHASAGGWSRRRHVGRPEKPVFHARLPGLVTPVRAQENSRLWFESRSQMWKQR